MKQNALSSVSFSHQVADIITSRFNQSYAMLIVGKMGSGKSLAAIELAYQVARWVATIKGGKWEDYFGMDNIAVITTDELKRVMGKMKRYNCYILDDIGVGINSRKFQTVINIAFNDIFTTWRTENTFLIATVPDSFLLDKVPRSLVNAFCEHEFSAFERNVSVFKLFEVSRKPREQKTYYIYPRGDGRRFLRLVVHKPPAELVTPYEKKRHDIAKQLKEERLEKFGTDVLEEEGGKSSGATPFEIEDRLKRGETPAQIREDTGTSYATIERIVRSLHKMENYH